MIHRSSKITGGVLLVAGTTIGAAVLALPVSTGMAGFIPAQVLMVLCWLFMTYTAFLVLEVNLWFEGNANMITMAKKTLGPVGRYLAWASYLFLLYSLMTAYIAVSGSLFMEFAEVVLGMHLPAWASPLPLLGLFSYFVYCGTKSVDHFNRWLMLGMSVAYGVLMVVVAPHIEAELLAHMDWKYTLVGVSVVITSFGFHIIIPTLTSYLERDVVSLKRVLVIGSIIPLIVYSLWQLAALGVIPQDSLRQGYVDGTNGAALITQIIGSPWVQIIARIFAFLAIMTSFLGVSLSLWDCLADGFKISNHGRGRAFLYVLTFVPPLFFALTSQRAFLSALEYAGAFGVVTLLAILPALMIWWGRYKLRLNEQSKSTFQVPGGKIALVCVILVSCVMIVVELLNKTGVIQTLLFK
ncbi:MAG: aromatic amino acid transport family protein [Chlamydiales bacterium]|nr:aromatic amino acid transport family protein [Chlamydiales bacterium]